MENTYVLNITVVLVGQGYIVEGVLGVMEMGKCWLT